MITVALPKGRTLGATLDRFARAGLVPEEDFSTTRKLIVPARGTQARFVLLKDPDVPLYVERGAAEVAGDVGEGHVDDEQVEIGQYDTGADYRQDVAGLRSVDRNVADIDG